jgi:hypothetical protein
MRKLIEYDSAQHFKIKGSDFIDRRFRFSIIGRRVAAGGTSVREPKGRLRLPPQHAGSAARGGATGHSWC